jgi:hypothetical protein
MHPAYGAPAKKTASTRLRQYNIESPGLPLQIIRETSSITAMLQQLQWQTLQSRRAYTQTVMMYRIVYNLVDIPAEHHLNRTSLRTRGHSLRFLVPHTRTTVYRTSFFSQATRLWNQLPGSVVESDTLDRFKAQLSMATLI